MIPPLDALFRVNTLLESSLRAGSMPAIPIGAAIGLALFYNGFYTTLYALSAIAMCLALAWAVFHPRLTAELQVGPAGMLLLLLGLWTLLGQAWSTVPYLTSIRSGVLGSAIAAYIVGRMSLPDPDARAAFGVGLGALGLTFAVAMIGQFALGQRPEGPFLNVNSAGAFVNLLWPLPAALSLHPGLPRHRRALLLAATAIMVFAVGITGGRAVALALLAALMVLLLGGRCHACWRRLGPLAGTVLASLAAAHASGQALGGGGAERVLGHRMAELADPGGAGASRLRIWESTLAMIAERPWLGWGPGTFHQAYPAWRLPRDGSAGYQVHNDYLQYWVDGGLPALLLLIGLSVVAVRLFFRGVRHTSACPVRRIIWLAASAALASAGLHALFSYNLQIMAYLIVLGVILAALELSTQSPQTPGITLWPIRRRPLATMAFVLLLAIPVVHVGTVAASHHYTIRGAVLLSEGRYEAADRALKKSVRFWDAQDVAPGLRARVRQRALATVPTEEAARRTQLKRVGRESVERALARNPHRYSHYLTLARLHSEPPKPDSRLAVSAYREALARNPRGVDARVELAQMLHRQGASDAALRVVNAGFGRHYERNDPIELIRLGIRLREQAGDAAGAESLRRQLRERDPAAGESGPETKRTKRGQVFS